jgi:signal transduction histidine kinase
VARFRDLSIGRKLSRASLLASVTALGAAALSFVLYDVYTFRDAMIRRIVTEARILGLNCVSPLLFDDAETARNTLAALKAEPHVESGAVFAQNGRLFATYARGDARVQTTAPAGGAAARFEGGHLVVAEPVLFEGKPLGTVVVRADLRELNERLVRYAAIAVLVLFGSLVAAQLLARRVHRTIVGPIRHLAAAAAQITENKDYSVRVIPESGDEIGTFTFAFNEMLAQIQTRDAALRLSQATLELRVEERTRELQKSSQELQAANRELEAFCYSVSHDLRAPLRGIDGFSRALLEDYAGKVLDDQGNHYLRRVRANTQRMGELIDDLLQLSRLTRTDLARRDIDLTQMVKAVASELQSRDPGRAVDLHVAEGMHVHADPHLLKIILENLLGNAWKFSGRRADPRVDVVAQPDRGERVFSVKDNGAGFDMKYADKLFGVFQRLHAASEFEGTGIGLATVQRIVHRHGGRIWAESVPEQGATFHFTLGAEA